MAKMATKVKLISPLTLLETLEVNVLACQPTVCRRNLVLLMFESESTFVTRSSQLRVLLDITMICNVSSVIVIRANGKSSQT
jgi:hypothetical protein